MLSFTELLSRFGPVRKVGKEYRVRCPVHGDEQPSLDIRPGDTSVALFQCRSAGCQTGDILRAVGLSWDDLIEPRNGHFPEWDHVHDYRDLTGTLRYRVFRRGSGAGKVIRQQAASGQWSMAGVERIPYQLHRLPGHARVFVAEGEKCVDRLWHADVPATCNVGGAKKWRPSDSEALKQAGVRDVIVLPDADEDGAAHAVMVKDACLTVGLTATILRIPGLAAKADVYDWLESGHTAAELLAMLEKADAPAKARTLTLVAASTIAIRPVKWLWQDRLALGTLGLLAGREGIGKSILAYTLAADITRGRLAGIYHGQPRAVIVAATEDSWAHTIVPRLMAAEADLAKVFRVDVHTLAGADVPLTLPIDLPELKAAILETHAALILLDPLMSRLDSGLDTHKDANVRQALEPLVALGDATGASLIGLIHLNKSASTDMLTLMMGSRAFAAVARSVLFAMEDPDTEGQRLLGQAKNNLGRSDLPTLTFSIAGAMVGTTEEGDVWTGKLVWGDTTDRSIRDALQASRDIADGDSEAKLEAANWLLDHLTSQDGEDDSASIKKAAQRAGHAVRTLQRARQKLRVLTRESGFPRKTYWRLPPTSREPGEDDAPF